ncbi:trypsin-like peptidase domain-containing protein [Chlorogloea sp. CCALA 695]|uniref:trypsin-like peptidase domain-containing protein n=1 Tax=Chlorogloea sp. CCALA 695 TaxID=2107693 RepID=UPI000D06BC0F|nr:trypsin-like peptidase domain-containing protein [Chlorogloea sp. CCALA 695]PSB31445.1 hypothetical protein C7B70_13145 [Chlorogloea sp. CCALA 695]
MNIKGLGIAIATTIFVGTTAWYIKPFGLFNPATKEVISAYAQDGDETAVKVYAKVSPAVVSINTGSKTGSGTIISSEGLVLTNAHVVQGDRTATIILANNKQIAGDIIGFGAKGLDLAVIKLRGQNKLPVVPFASTNSVLVGQRVFAIGNPFGQFSGSLTTGIISRIDREKGLIQTDAAINPGYSGGPLLNTKGELIGVNSGIFTKQTPGGGSGNIGISFAISTEKVQSFLSDVRAGSAAQTAQIPANPGRSSVHSEALARFEAALKQNPQDYRAQNGRGLALGNLGRAEEALAAFEQALKINPSFTEAWNGKGITLGRLKRHEQALAAFEQALKINPSAEAWNGKGIALGSLGRDQEALAAFEQALKINPSFTPAQRNRTIALKKLNS